MSDDRWALSDEQVRAMSILVQYVTLVAHSTGAMSAAMVPRREDGGLYALPQLPCDLLAAALSLAGRGTDDLFWVVTTPVSIPRSLTRAALPAFVYTRDHIDREGLLPAGAMEDVDGVVLAHCPACLGQMPVIPERMRLVLETGGPVGAPH